MRTVNFGELKFKGFNVTMSEPRRLELVINYLIDQSYNLFLN